MSIRTRTTTWSLGLAGLLFFVVVVSVGIRAVTIPPRTVATILTDTMSVPIGVSLGDTTVLPVVGPVPTPMLESISPFEFAIPRPARVIMLSVRLPRILLTVFVGLAPTAARIVIQGFFHNPMADPSIVGVSSGTTVSAVATIVLSLSVPFGLEDAVFANAVITAFVAYLLANEGGRTPVATLFLAGAAIQAFLGAIISSPLLQSGESLRQVAFWFMGHLMGATRNEIGMLSLVLPLPFLLPVVHTRGLNVLLLDEEDARALGIEVKRTKQLLLATASIITVAAASISGVIGFVGLIVPYMLRLLIGPDHRVLLPASTLAGTSFLVATGTVARFGGTEIPVDVVTAAVGASFFPYLLRTREVRSS